MLETIRIRKLGFPIRREFVAFRDRYRLLAPSSAWEKDDRKACSMILDVRRLPSLQTLIRFHLRAHDLTLLNLVSYVHQAASYRMTPGHYTLGLSKVFMRDEQVHTIPV
jgi:hypothetical protein